MAKEIDPARMRLIYVGPESGPTVLKAEYACKDGDLFSTPVVKEFTSPSFSPTMSAQWQASVTAVESDEGIS